MSTSDGALWPNEPVPAGVEPAPDAGNDRDHNNRDNNNVDDRRMAAELDNARKRCLRQTEEARASAQAAATSAWLPVLDNLERAVVAATEACESRSLVAGLEALRDQAIAVVERLGYRRHGEVGMPFDPYLHEAVGVRTDPDSEPGTVAEVVRAGYGEGDRQLRPAGVVVARQQG